MTPEEKTAKEVLLRATEDLLGDKRKLLEQKKAEMEKLTKDNEGYIQARDLLSTEIIALGKEITATERIFINVRDTKRVKSSESSSSACVV